MQSIEFAQVEVQVVEGLKVGNQILKELQEEIKIDDVEKLMDDTAEAIAYQNVITTMAHNLSLSHPFHLGNISIDGR